MGDSSTAQEVVVKEVRPDDVDATILDVNRITGPKA